jgi:hypothetical protein
MQNNKYLENKLGLIQASIAGHCIGVSFVIKEGGDYHYDMGEKIRLQIEKDIRQLYRYAYNQGRKDSKTNK